MSGPDLPRLADTGRKYVENTIRARLQSPGVERYVARRRSRAGALTIALLLAAALVALFFRLAPR